MIKKYVENKYYMNDFLDVQIFPAFSTAKKGRRKAKINISSDVQKKLNEENSRKYVDRLVHTNFTNKDFALDLTYAKEPLTAEEAQRHMKNYIRRLQRIYKKAGAALKYIYVTERGVKNGRYHHHLIISGGVSRDEIENAWLCKDYAGRANCDRLQFIVTGIADRVGYISGRKKEKQEAEKVGYRKWTSSKNLVKPEPKQNKSRLRLRDVEEIFAASEYRQMWERLYPGYYFGECGRSYYNELNGGFYISARLYRKEATYVRRGRT